MANIRPADIWYLNLISSKPGSSYCKVEDVIDILATDEDDEIVINTDIVSPTYVEVQRMIESALQICEEKSFEHCLGALMEAKVVNLFQTASQWDANSEKNPVYQAMEKLVRRAVACGAAIDVIHTKVNTLAKLQELY